MMRLALAGVGLALGVSLCGCFDDAQVQPAAPTSGACPDSPEVLVHISAPEPRAASCKFAEPTCEARCLEGDPASCNNFAAMLELGRGVAQDRPKALTIYKNACLVGGSQVACVNQKRLLAEGVQSPDTAPEKTATAAPSEPAGAEKSPAPAPDADATASTAPSPEGAPKPACSDAADCQARCNKGDEAACDMLPGVHIRGNVHISGNVKIFGNVYIHSH